MPSFFVGKTGIGWYLGLERSGTEVPALERSDAQGRIGTGTSPSPPWAHGGCCSSATRCSAMPSAPIWGLAPPELGGPYACGRAGKRRSSPPCGSGVAASSSHRGSHCSHCRRCFSAPTERLLKQPPEAAFGRLGGRETDTVGTGHGNHISAALAPSQARCGTVSLTLCDQLSSLIGDHTQQPLQPPPQQPHPVPASARNGAVTLTASLLPTRCWHETLHRSWREEVRSAEAPGILRSRRDAGTKAEGRSGVHSASNFERSLLSQVARVL